MSKKKSHKKQEPDGSRYAYIQTMIEVRDRVHERLIQKKPEQFQRIMMSQNYHLSKNLGQNKACCIKEFNLITPDLLSSLAATRYRLLTSISEYELINIIAREICEAEVPTDWVADILFETCMYFYTQKKLMKMLRLASLEQRLKHLPKRSSYHNRLLNWVRDQKERVFSVDDNDDILFYEQLVG